MTGRKKEISLSVIFILQYSNNLVIIIIRILGAYYENIRSKLGERAACYERG